MIGSEREKYVYGCVCEDMHLFMLWFKGMRWLTLRLGMNFSLYWYLNHFHCDLIIQLQ